MGYQIARLRPRHHGIIDYLLANPHLSSMEEVCVRFQVTRSWLSTLMQTDLFKAEWERRRNLHTTAMLQGVRAKQARILDKSLDILNELLDDMQEDGGIPDPKFVADLADQTAKQLGFGPTPGGRPKLIEETEREFTTVDNGTLTVARERMRRTLVPDAESSPVPTDET